jgi:hypothetical protein
MATLDAGPVKVEKRNRPPISCEPCRTRKYATFPLPQISRRRHAHRQICRLKCDRSSPCSACVRRDISSLCKYAVNASRSKPGRSKPRDVKDRLNTLENLVSSLLSGNAVIQSGLLTENELNTEDDENISSSVEQYNGPMKHGSALSNSSGGEDALTQETPHLQETGDGRVNYIDPGHWLSILDDIKEVREHLSVTDQPSSQSKTGFDVDRAVPDAGFLFSPDQNSSLDEILSSLPPQPICDMLLSWYFNSRFMVLGKTETSTIS